MGMHSTVVRTLSAVVTAALGVVLGLVIGVSPATAVGPVLLTNIPAGSSMGFVAMSPEGTMAYVTGSGPNQVLEIDVATDTVVRIFPLPSAPRGIAVSPDGTRAYVALYNVGQVAILDLAGGTVVGTLPTGFGAFGVAFTPSGSRVFVTNYGASSVTVIDAATETVIETIAGLPTTPLGIAMSPVAPIAYVSFVESHKVLAIDTETNAVLETIPVGFRPYQLAISPDGSTAYIASGPGQAVNFLDLQSQAVTSTVSLGGMSKYLEMSADGSTLWVSNEVSDRLVVINTALGQVTGTVAVGSDPQGVAAAGTKGYVGNLMSEDVSVVDLRQSPAILSDSGSAVEVGRPMSFTVRASGFPVPDLTQAGGLPAGVTFVDNGDGTATLSGTPATPGSFAMTLTADNAVSPDATQNFRLLVGLAPVTGLRVTSVPAALQAVWKAVPFAAQYRVSLTLTPRGGPSRTSQRTTTVTALTWLARPIPGTGYAVCVQALSGPVTSTRTCVSGVISRGTRIDGALKGALARP